MNSSPSSSLPPTPKATLQHASTPATTTQLPLSLVLATTPASTANPASNSVSSTSGDTKSDSSLEMRTLGSLNSGDSGSAAAIEKLQLLTQPRSLLRTPRTEFSSLSEANTVIIYREEILFLRNKSEKMKAAENKESKNKPQTKLRISRDILAQRSPGSRPRILLSLIEAEEHRTERRRKYRNPGAPPTAQQTPKRKVLEQNERSPVTVGISSSIKRSSTTHSITSSTRNVHRSTKSLSAESVREETNTSPSASGFLVEPKTAEFTLIGGRSSHLLLNETNVRLAIKVRSSNNESFRVNPVYTFLDPGTMNELELIRLPGGVPRKDKLLICYTTAGENDKDAKKLFNVRANIQNVVVRITTKSGDTNQGKLS